jgi:imidazolonepropionase-like amidohydrolase
VIRSAALLVVLAAFVPTSSLTAKPQRHLYIAAGTLIDAVGGQALHGQCIEVRNDKIVAVGPCGAEPIGAERLDWSEYTVLPGLIDLHTHLADAGQSADLAAPIKTSPQLTALHGAANALKTLKAGFTTVRDVGTYRGLTDIALRDAIDQGLVPGPRMAVAGAYLTHPGGGGELNGVVPNDQLPADMRLGVARRPEAVAARATYLLDNKVDFLKLMATGAVLAIGTEPGAPELTEDEMRVAAMPPPMPMARKGSRPRSAQACVRSNMPA